jgi:hypothetical protein
MTFVPRETSVAAPVSILGAPGRIFAVPVSILEGLDYDPAQ